MRCGSTLLGRDRPSRACLAMVLRAVDRPVVRRFPVTETRTPCLLAVKAASIGHDTRRRGAGCEADTTGGRVRRGRVPDHLRHGPGHACHPGGQGGWSRVGDFQLTKPWWKSLSISSERSFVTTSSKTLGDWLKDFEREAFRLETLDDYSKSGGVDSYRAFLAGEPQPEEYKTAGWMTTVGNAVRSGLVRARSRRGVRGRPGPEWGCACLRCGPPRPVPAVTCAAAAAWGA